MVFAGYRASFPTYSPRKSNHNSPPQCCIRHLPCSIVRNESSQQTRSVSTKATFRFCFFFCSVNTPQAYTMYNTPKESKREKYHLLVIHSHSYCISPFFSHRTEPTSLHVHIVTDIASAKCLSAREIPEGVCWEF